MLEQFWGKAGRVSRRLVPLGEPELVARACRETRLSDLGDGSFHEPLHILLESYDREASLSLLGRILVRQDTLRLLKTRLELIEAWRRHPEIVNQPVCRPIFVTGLPRSGTTLLHRLLAQDPALRVPLVWEVLFPVPACERANYETDPRIAKAEKMIGWFHRSAPEFRAIYPVSARLPQECIAITTYTFQSPQFHTTHNVPAYQAWLLQQDQLAYAFHRRFLQHLQWRSPAQRWVLKAPAHLLALDAIFKTYPDAYIIHTHPDPLKTLPSSASLTRVLRRISSYRVDRAEIGLEVTERWSEGVKRALKARDAQDGRRDRFIDVHYPAFMRDPIESVRRVYTQVGLDFTLGVETRIQRFLSANPENREHRYTLEEFGLDPKWIMDRFKGYCERFAIAPETA